MLGQIRWQEGRKLTLEQERLLDLPLLTLSLPERARTKERVLQKGVRLLAGQRVSRVLAPPDCEIWPLLNRYGLRPVDTRALRCALAGAWAETALKKRGVRPEQAVLTLSGTRESPDMVYVARVLCPRVRNLVIDVPGQGSLAARLRREYGMPVLPARCARADLTLPFRSGPVLSGAVFSLRDGRALPAECEALSVLSVLWENNRIKTEDIVVQM